MGTWKRCSDWLDRSYFTPLGNQFWIAIELIVSHTSVCRVGYFDAQIRETALYKQGAQFTLLLGVNITNHLQGTDITKQLAFLAIPSHCFWLNQLIFTVLHFWVLDRSFVHSTPPFGGEEGRWYGQAATPTNTSAAAARKRRSSCQAALRVGDFPSIIP